MSVTTSCKLDRTDAIQIAKDEHGWLTVTQYEVAKCAAVVDLHIVKDKVAFDLYQRVVWVVDREQTVKAVAAMLRRSSLTQDERAVALSIVDLRAEDAERDLA